MEHETPYLELMVKLRNSAYGLRCLVYMNENSDETLLYLVDKWNLGLIVQIALIIINISYVMKLYKTQT